MQNNTTTKPLNQSKMKTAVEWLVKKLKKYELSNYDVKLKIIEEAKRKEKKHLYNFVDFINERHFNSFRISKDEVEQYYNETFKSDEQE